MFAANDRYDFIKCHALLPMQRSQFILLIFLYLLFFFQAEDGIRDSHVTGVQTCALPICLIANMITGVTTGFQKELEITGVGYRATLQGNKLVIGAGYSHPVEFEQEDNIEFEVPKNSEIIIKGIEKERVGAIASVIRAVRPPEPYKGKGIHYKGEIIRRKEGKTAK